MMTMTTTTTTTKYLESVLKISRFLTAKYFALPCLGLLNFPFYECNRYCWYNVLIAKFVVSQGMFQNFERVFLFSQSFEWG